MAVSAPTISDNEVRAILRKKKFSFHGNRLAGIHLARKDPDPKKRFKMTGQPRVILMSPVSIAHYQEIMRKSSSAEEAAEQIEAISSGRQLAPNFGSGGGIDSGVIETMVANRVGNEVAKVTDALGRENAELRRKLDEIIAGQAAKPAKGKPGRPKGSKNKKPADPDDDPELTPEQEKILAKLNMSGS
jgi:hypothetical protein